MKLRLLILGTVVFAAAAGFGIGFIFSPKDSMINGEVRLGRGILTNPLLECSAANGTINSSKQDFRSELDFFVSNLESKQSITKIAVTFRDLNNGPSFGINRDEPFVPASLLKVPVLMSFLKHSEREPEIFQRKLVFTKETSIGFTPEFAPKNELVSGKSYSISELLERMIIQSDNQALLLLWPEISAKEFKDLYSQLGVDSSVVEDARATLSVRQYATFFRILYNASFISQENSEKALNLLSQTTFNGGLRAGVPQDIMVAHKFGERKLEDGKQHLHDCGIVYYPKHPYLLCIMSRGDDIEALESSIRDISRFVYEQMEEQY